VISQIGGIILSEVVPRHDYPACGQYFFFITDRLLSGVFWDFMNTSEEEIALTLVEP
jgi:hypothetical protein